MAALAYNADAKRAAYARVDAALTSFFAKYPSCDVTGRMASVNSFLRHELHDVMSFIGFYVVKTPGEMLQIGPYQGAVLATALIPFGKGQCGVCAAEQKTQIAADVSVCANYIPCDDVTRSEIVVPVFGYNYHNEPDATTRDPEHRKLIAVLDIDSELLAAFDEVDKEALEALMAKWF